jgi:hypothetical protein
MELEKGPDVYRGFFYIIFTAVESLPFLPTPPSIGTGVGRQV